MSSAEEDENHWGDTVARNQIFSHEEDSYNSAYPSHRDEQPSSSASNSPKQNPAVDYTPQLEDRENPDFHVDYGAKGEPESWLLRLFESDFFDSRLAISYLFKYPKSIGIHHYICKALQKFNEADIRFLLPQICHIMISRPEDSVALEEFIMLLCQTSHHMAILTLWYLESYLNDLHRAMTTNSKSYELCKRLYLGCQAIIFAEAKPSSKSIVSDLIEVNVQKSAHIPPSIVGIGLLLSSVAAPVAHNHAKPLVVLESRKPRFFNPWDDTDSNFADDSDSDDLNDAIVERSNRRKKIWNKIFARVPTESPSLDQLSSGDAFAFGSYLKKINSDSELDRHSNATSVELLNQDTTENHSQLLRSHYFYSEIQFIMTLVDISDRLISVPKAARQASLIAELSLLNHNLPASVCIPFWCPAVASNHLHHKIARIALSDCVVLNSADRVPFLILVEVLEATPHPSSDSRSHEQEVSQIPANGGPIMTVELPPSRYSDLNTSNSIKSHLDSAEYHQRVISRRISAAYEHNPHTKTAAIDDGRLYKEVESEVESEEGIDLSSAIGAKGRFQFPKPKPLVIEKKHSEVSLPISLNDDANESGWEDEGVAIKLSIGGGPAAFADKMRTAAVLLAQLYQKQQRAPENDSTGKGRLRSSSIVSNAESMAKSMLTPTTPMSASSSTALPSKRSQKKRKNEFEVIRKRVLEEMSATEDERLRFLMSNSKEKKDTASLQVDELLAGRDEEELQRNNEDPSASVFSEPWEEKKKRIRAESPFGSDPNWQLYSVIVKSGADLRQEQLALQLISEMQRSWNAFRIPIWVYPFSIMITSDQSGLVEVIPDSISIHSLKKNGYAKRFNQPGIAYTLYDHFIREFGEPGSNGFEQAQDNFTSSLAGYSLISYILQLKDRHNGNILLDRSGHITHIDFGFMLMNSPGSVGFEMAPFKMPQEYIDVLGGYNSDKFEDFRELMKLGFLALRKRSESIISLVEIMEKDSRLPCFTGVNKPINSPEKSISGTPVTQALRDRLHLRLTDDACSDLIDSIINSSCTNTFTALYDSFQYYANGIL